MITDTRTYSLLFLIIMVMFFKCASRVPPSLMEKKANVPQMESDEGREMYRSDNNQDRSSAVQTNLESVPKDVFIKMVAGDDSTAFKNTLRLEQLKTGDQLEIKIYDKLPLNPEPRFEVQRIDQKGNIFVLPVGEVSIGGLPIDSAEKKIEHALSEYVKSPHCDISIQSRTYAPKAYIFGSVNTPGQVPISGHERLLDVISKSGGLASGAYKRSIKLLRLDKNEVKMYSIDLSALLEKGELNNNMAIQDNDIVYIPKRFISSFSEVLTSLTAILPWYSFFSGFGN